MKILYIENHSIFAQSVQKEFLSAYDVTLVPSMKEALNVLEVNHYDIALVDYDLDDCKGNEVTIKIKSLYPGVKIIAVSSHSKGNDLILNAGADAVCGKMDFKHIKTVIDSLFS